MATFRSYTIPAPVGGLNASDPIASMPETDAIRLINFFPERGKISLRKGHREHSTGLGGAVYSLYNYNKSDGTTKLIGCANGKIWDATTYGASATQLATGFTENKWQATNFKDRLFLCNGTDAPQTYDGSTIGATGMTGSGLTASNLINVSTFKERLYYVEKNSGYIWWANTVGAVTTPTLNKLDVSAFLNKGGRIIFAGSYSGNTGQGLEDLFCAVSDQGEALVYSGSFPTASNWGLVGRYYLPKPVGAKYRSFANLNADLIGITESGVFPLSTIFSDKLALEQDNSFSTKINELFNAYAKEYTANYGWEIQLHTPSRMAFINVPISSSTYRQFVVNTLSGAWAEFRGLNGITFASHNNKLYFGGTDGTVYECDYGYNDNGSAIDCEMKWAFNYLGSPGQMKVIKEVRPLMSAENSIELKVGADPDFEDNTITGTTNLQGASGTLWDEGDWDTFDWSGGVVYNKNWEVAPCSSTFGCVAFKLKGSILDIATDVYGLQVIFDIGGSR